MHDSAHIRGDFCAWIDAGRPETAVVQIDFEPTVCRARELLVEIRDCSGVVPAYYCAELNMPQGTTYAEAAEALLREIGNGGALTAP